jgi:pimeloyl-ACP methyl ester carboxylesterase
MPGLHDETSSHPFTTIHQQPTNLTRLDTSTNTMATKPAFVFVPGAWHTAETWTKVTSALVTQGYESVSVTLPTTSGDASASFVEDVKATRNAIEAQLSQKRDVIVVVHSYGGVVGQSAMKDLTSVSSLTGRIIGLVVIASGYAQPGMAFLDGTGGTPPPTWRLHPSGFAELQVPAQALFYDDLPQAEADEWTAKLTKQSTRAFTEGREVTYPGWKDVPVWVSLVMKST